MNYRSDLESREAFGVREACFRFSQFLAKPNGKHFHHAFVLPISQSGSKLHALQTLREVVCTKVVTWGSDSGGCAINGGSKGRARIAPPVLVCYRGIVPVVPAGLAGVIVLVPPLGNGVVELAPGKVVVVVGLAGVMVLPGVRLEPLAGGVIKLEPVLMLLDGMSVEEVVGPVVPTRVVPVLVLMTPLVEVELPVPPPLVPAAASLVPPAAAPYNPLVEISPLTMALVGMACGGTCSIRRTL